MMLVHRHNNTGIGRAYGETARMRVPDGDAGTMETIQAIRAFAHDAAFNSPMVQQTAAQIVASAPRNDRLAQLRSLYRFLRESVFFKPDTFGAEHLRSPDQLLTEINANGRTSADCDDVATLASALLRAMGFEPRIALVARSNSVNWEHVHPVAVFNGSMIPLDPQEDTPFGEWTHGQRRAIYDA